VLRVIAKVPGRAMLESRMEATGRDEVLA